MVNIWYQQCCQGGAPHREPEKGRFSRRLGLLTDLLKNGSGQLFPRDSSLLLVCSRVETYACQYQVNMDSEGEDVERDVVSLESGVLLGEGVPEDSQLRVLVFTACYFVLDGVTLTIRRLESYLRARGAVVKIVSTARDDIDKELLRDIIQVPGIGIPWAAMDPNYAFGAGLDEATIREIEKFRPNIVHFTVPDLVGIDGIRWCQKNNVAYMATWHSNYCDYLKYYFLDWLVHPVLYRYLKGFYEQIPVVYVPTPYIRN